MEWTNNASLQLESKMLAVVILELATYSNKQKVIHLSKSSKKVNLKMRGAKRCIFRERCNAKQSNADNIHSPQIIRLFPLITSSFSLSLSVSRFSFRATSTLSNFSYILCHIYLLKTWNIVYAPCPGRCHPITQSYVLLKHPICRDSTSALQRR